MIAIFDLQHTQRSMSIPIFYCVFYGTENMLLPLKLCCYHVYISWDSVITLFSAAILDFWLPVSFGSDTDSTIVNFDPQNMEVAVGICFLASLEAEIPQGIVLPPLLQHKRH